MALVVDAASLVAKVERTDGKAAPRWLSLAVVTYEDRGRKNGM